MQVMSQTSMRLMANAIEEISTPRRRSFFMLPDEIVIRTPDGNPSGTLVWESGAQEYRFYSREGI